MDFLDFFTNGGWAGIFIGSFVVMIYVVVITFIISMIWKIYWWLCGDLHQRNFPVNMEDNKENE
jgi:hypothetical protein